MATYEEILTQLSGEMGADLAPDRNNTCLIQLEDGVEVRIEPHKTGTELLIGMLVGELDPGPGRETFLQAALIANGRAYPRYGDFSYSRQINQLVLTETLPLDELTGKVVKDSMMEMVEKGRVWAKALQTGSAPVSPLPRMPSSPLDNKHSS